MTETTETTETVETTEATPSRVDKILVVGRKRVREAIKLVAVQLSNAAKGLSVLAGRLEQASEAVAAKAA